MCPVDPLDARSGLPTGSLEHTRGGAAAMTIRVPGKTGSRAPARNRQSLARLVHGPMAGREVRPHG